MSIFGNGGGKGTPTQQWRTIAVNLPASITPTDVRLDDGNTFSRTVDNPHRWAFLCPERQSSFNLHIGADGYAPYDRVVTVPAHGVDIIVEPWPNPPNAHQVIVPAMVSIIVRPFPAETGLITVSGTRFLNDGKVWGWRGVSLFLALARWLAGDGNDEQRAWCIKHGINVIRVWGAGVGWQDNYLPYMSRLNFARPFDRPDYPAQLASFLAFWEAAGIRVEFVIVTDKAVSLADYQRAAQMLYDAAAAGRLSHFIERVNEPWVSDGRVSPSAVGAGLDPHGVLSAYGIQPEGIDGSEDYAGCPTLAYGTAHLPRDRAHVHNGRDILRMMSANPVPWVDDEPMGFADYDKSGGGARTTDLDWIVSHHAVARLFAPGQTMHPQCGLEGRAPNATEPITEAIATAVTDMWRFIPDDCYAGRYSRAGFPDFPCVYNPDDSEVDHGYASIMGNVAYAVIPLPTAAWRARGLEAANSWRLDAVGPVPYVGRFVR